VHGFADCFPHWVQPAFLSRLASVGKLTELSGTPASSTTPAFILCPQHPIRRSNVPSFRELLERLSNFAFLDVSSVKIDAEASSRCSPLASFTRLELPLRPGKLPARPKGLAAIRP
jgi:hypothetical protein